MSFLKALIKTTKEIKKDTILLYLHARSYRKSSQGKEKKE